MGEVEAVVDMVVAVEATVVVDTAVVVDARVVGRWPSSSCCWWAMASHHIGLGAGMFHDAGCTTTCDEASPYSHSCVVAGCKYCYNQQTITYPAECHYLKNPIELLKENIRKSE